MRITLAVIAAAVLASLAAAAPPPTGGFRGLVFKGPIRPVCTSDEACDAPASVTLLFSRAGRTTAARSASDGRYRVLLPAGIYTVTTKEKIGIQRNIRPRNVKVRSGHVDQLDFFIDTGIR